MRVVSILGLKGGSTKSTITAHLAVAAHHAGILTAIVDTDPQATLRMWSTRRQTDGPPVRPETTPDFLEPTLREFERQGAELVLIDTAGKAEIMGKRAAELSDLVLIPSRTSLADMDAVPTSHAMAQNLGKPNFVIFTDVDVSGAKKDVKEAAAGFTSRGIPTGREHGAPFICHRKGYKSCLIDGSTIQEIEPGGKGAEEIDALFRWVAKQVGLKVKRRRTEKANG